MDQFLERHNPAKLTQGTDNLNKPISIIKIESKINNLPKKSLGLNGFTGDFCQAFKEEIISSVQNFFQKKEAEGILSDWFHKGSITVIIKLDKDTTRKEN